MSQHQSFDIAGVTRRARREGRYAGRRAGLGRPLADRPDDLPGRLWIRERFAEFVAEAERQLATRRRVLGEHAQVRRERLRALDDEITAARDAADLLADWRAEDRRRPRHEQDLALEYNAREAHERLRHLLVSRQGVTLELTGLDAQLEELDREYTAWPTRLWHACDAALQEHDIAYARGQQAPGVLVRRRLRRGAARPRFGEAAS